MMRIAGIDQNVNACGQYSHIGRSRCLARFLHSLCRLALSGPRMHVCTEGQECLLTVPNIFESEHIFDAGGKCFAPSVQTCMHGPLSASLYKSCVQGTLIGSICQLCLYKLTPHHRVGLHDENLTWAMLCRNLELIWLQPQEQLMRLWSCVPWHPLCFRQVQSHRHLSQKPAHGFYCSLPLPLPLPHMV